MELDCPLLSLQRFLHPEIGLFSSSFSSYNKGVGEKNLFWLLHDLPTSHLSDYPLPTLPHSHSVPDTLACWLVWELARFSSASGPLTAWHSLSPV